MKKLISIFTLLACTISNLQLSAQGNSPYSELGIGNAVGSHFQSNFAMGGLGATYGNKFQINYLNPASYSKIKYTIGEAGVYSSTNFYSDGTNSTHESTFNFGNFGMGLPLSNNLGLAFGIKPFAQTRYNYSFADITADNIDITRKFSGDGNINEVFTGVGYKIKNWSIGANAHYYFGEVVHTEQLEFLTSNYSSVRERSFNLARGWSFTGGSTYELALGEEDRLILGAIYQLGTNIKNRSYSIINNYTVETVTVDNENVDIESHSTEALFSSEDSPNEGSINLPSTYRAGISYMHNKNVFIGLDYENTAWENLTVDGTNSGLGRAQKLILGGEYIPTIEVKGLENYWKSVIYRGGISIGQNAVVINGTPLNEYGIKFGLGFPLKKMKFESEKFGSYLFASLGYDYLGGTNASITEHFVKVNFSVVLNDKWFVKRKFD